MLTDPREALAEQSNFVSYLVGLVGLARVVDALAADGNRRADAPHEADDLVHLLLGLTSVGEAIERLAKPVEPQGNQATPSPSANTRWLR